MKSIAIVILNWNGKEFLQKFLPGVVDYSAVDSFLVKVVVADNGSTDGSTQWVKANLPSVEVIELEKNFGFTGGYNRALKQVEADYFLLLNSDVQVEPHWLMPLVGFMESNQQAAACMPKILSYNNPQLFEYAGAAGGYIDFLGYPFCRGRLLNILEEDKGQYDTVQEVFWATGACMLVRASEYWNAGGLDDDFFAHMEEIDLCWRLKRQGYSIWCVPQSRVFHVGGGTLTANNPRKVYFNHRNNLLMLIKNLSRRSFVPVILLRILLDLGSALVYGITGKPKFTWALIRAHIHVIKASLKTIRKRRQFKQPKLSLYRRSVVFEFFFMGRKKYSDLPSK